MHRIWPSDFLPGECMQLLQLPRHFAELAQLVPEEAVTAPCGPDPRAHLTAVQAFTDAGFDEVYISQAGGEVEGFFRFYAEQVLPELRQG
jgi:hypothetical protein